MNMLSSLHVGEREGFSFTAGLTEQGDGFALRK